MTAKKVTLSGWGNIPKSKSLVSDAADTDSIKDLLSNKTVIARGLGRSYADQSTNANKTVIKTEQFNRVLSFNTETGMLTCEAGLSLKDIIYEFTPKGWFPMVTPGTKYITVAGAIANDVHGKAHHVDGTFANCVDHFSIMLVDGTVLNASRKENDDLFWANFGGLGLLGVILEVTMRLRKIETTYFKQKAIVVNNLEEMLKAIDDSGEEYSSSVAWIDSLARGENLGKGVLTVGNTAKIEDLPNVLKSKPLRTGKTPLLNVPFFLPSFTLNKLTVSILNKILFSIQKRGKEIVHYEKFFYPLDGINNWNRGYGS